MWETKRNIKTNSNGGNKDMKCRDEEVRGQRWGCRLLTEISLSTPGYIYNTSTDTDTGMRRRTGRGREGGEKKKREMKRWLSKTSKQRGGYKWKGMKNVQRQRERERKVAEVVYKELLKRALNLRVTWCSKCKGFWAVSCLNEHTVNIMQIMTIFRLIPLFFVENMDVYVIRMNLIRVKGSNTVRATWRLSASWSECSGERKSTRADGLLNRRRNCTWSAGWVTVRPQTLTDNLTNIQKEQQVKEL